MLRLIGVVLAVPLIGDEKKAVEATCPLDGHKFTAYDITSWDFAKAWGGMDRDFCKHAFKTTPLEYLAWVCPGCGFAGVKADFDAKNALTDEQKDKLRGKLTPAVAVRKGMKQEAVPGHAKFDLVAQVYLLKEAPPERAGLAYLNAAWCARQQGTPWLDGFDEWADVRKDHNLETMPMDLGEKNRTDVELEIARRVEKKIEEKREQEKRDQGIVKECDAKIAELKKDAKGNAEAIRKEEQRRGDARGRLQQVALLKYTALWCVRRHGENVDALKWIEELRTSKGDNSVIDDAVEAAAKSIELERGYQKKAAEQYEKAVAGGKLDKRVAGQCQYLLGELARRLGDRAKAAEWYRKAVEEPSIKKTAEEQLKLVE